MEVLAERKRSVELLAELNRTQSELSRVKSSATLETDSRLQAEVALGESQERLQLALDAAGLALWDCRYPFTDVYLSARWGELLGDIALEGNWRAADLVERLHPEELDGLRRQLRRVLDGEVQRTSVEYRFKAGEEWVWLEAHAMVAEVDLRGRVTRLMGTQANITKRKQIEEKATQALLMAEQASRAKSEFLANISHEIRTPLNAIMGLNQLLLGSQQSNEHRQWLQLMDDSSRVLLNLLNDVLDFARIEAGKLHLENIAFPLRPLFESTSKTYLEQARLKSVDMKVYMSPELPSSMLGDPLRIRQVLTNLLSNAVKFTPAGGQISLSVDASREAGLVKRLIFKVADSGIGIAPEQHKAMFEAFTQADSSTARQHGGSGLGLAICATLVKAMGGRIRLESSLGQGCKFEVELPVKDISLPKSDQKMAPQTVAKADVLTDRRFENIRVIVAEDNTVNVRLMRDALRQIGCEVRVARNGDEAIKQWREWTADLVLMDVQMPGVSGLEATARIRELERRMQRPPVPILAVTANAMAGDQEAYLAAGMSGYVSKPVDFPRLFQTMSKALETRASGEVRDTQPSEGHAIYPASTRKRNAHIQQTLERKTKSLQSALARRDPTAAQLELEALVEALSALRAERVLRICRGLEMARHAGEWGLFARAFPLLEAEIAALIGQLGSGTVGGT
ncbi:PAS domain-containing hybrid sensor histidine kinase/response regulator [Hydrogenophaga sp. BPS33]|uniref:PAS domain-containing hybrid sensor histidine kinase/response regulator n=1 Tax=Hydrogenophaga sp. BPS33 TaxID=2651974 RepID=UPI00135A1196|nr:PAS domain-containing hybrid sensor histidine kinase/response regulator [Hydrogenophaga sp. BPS33]